MYAHCVSSMLFQYMCFKIPETGIYIMRFQTAGIVSTDSIVQIMLVTGPVPFNVKSGTCILYTYRLSKVSDMLIYKYYCQEQHYSLLK